MTTAEKTISMLNSLDETEQLDVQRYIRRIFVAKNRRSSYSLKPLTEKQIVKKVNSSIAQAERGEVYSLTEVKKEVAKEYGF